MKVIDKNQTLEPPEGDLIATYARGGYLSLVYYTPTTRTEIFLNDQGREVLRTVKEIELPPDPAPVMTGIVKYVVPGRWASFKDGFWVVCEGLLEMLRAVSGREQ